MSTACRTEAQLWCLVVAHIDVMLVQASNVLPQLRDGTIRSYAVTAKTRNAHESNVVLADFSSPELPPPIFSRRGSRRGLKERTEELGAWSRPVSPDRIR